MQEVQEQLKELETALGTAELERETQAVAQAPVGEAQTEADRFSDRLYAKGKTKALEALSGTGTAARRDLLETAKDCLEQALEGEALSEDRRERAQQQAKAEHSGIDEHPASWSAHANPSVVHFLSDDDLAVALRRDGCRRG